MPLPRSKFWYYYIKKDYNIAMCLVCSKHIKYSGNTSNLAKHLKQHPNVITILDKQKSTSLQVPDTSTASEIVDISFDTNDNNKIKTGPSESITSSLSLSINPTCNGCSTSSSTVVVESDSDKVKILKQPIITAFKNIGSYSEGETRHNIITNCLLYFICKDRQPFHIVNGEGFKHLMKEIVPSYKIPSKTTFKKRLDEKYEVFSHIYQLKFQKILHFCITCDVWSEMMTARSFLEVTLHFLDGSAFNSVCIATRELSECHTSDFISQELLDILASWKIDANKIVAVVTDNASNMISAVNKGFGKNKHLPCFAHTINLIAESVTNNIVIAPIISKIRNIVKHAKKSIIVSEKIRKIQLSTGISEGNIKKLVLDVKTRWNSVYYMLERFIIMANIIGQVLLSDPKSPPMATAGELEIIKQLIYLLRPLEFVTRELSGENYVTISKIIPMISCLKDQINEIISDDEIVITGKNVLLGEINKKFGQVEMNKQLAIATLLDPRFRNLHFQNVDACNDAIKCLRKNISTDSSSSDSETEFSSNYFKDQNQENYDFWSHHKLLVYGIKKSGGKNKIKDEISIYLDSPVSPLKSDPLQYWEETKMVFPLLYKQAKIHFTVTATSVPAERLFSKAGATVSQDRNRLLSSRLEKLLFLADCKEEEWFE